MNILVACDSYKGCMSSAQANQQIKKGLIAANPELEVSTFEIADGGEGMVDAFVEASQGQIRKASCFDLYGRRIIVRYGYDPKTRTACVEAASCLGLTLYPKERRQPLETSSYGLGVLIREVIKTDVETLIIGLGGTGTNDAGMGMLEAFGAVFYNKSRRRIHASSGTLNRIAFIDKSHFHFPGQISLVAACDVNNPLLGEQGATFIFGKQKGLSKMEQYRTESGVSHAADKIEQTFHVDIRSKPGSGAAGGLGGMLIGVLDARMEPGLEILARIGQFEEKIQNADLVITGEGQSDLQTLYGKAVFSVAQMAQAQNVPVIVLSGALCAGYEKLYDYGICGIFSTADRAMTFPVAIAQGPQKLEQAAFSLMKLIDAISALTKKKSVSKTEVLSKDDQN
ncbi:glycerate kinase family protein [Ileibacterium valens]|uniref:glycerate kinase family protein n=1 Tax=Ileibacterium valens TaxID=1862668 RepID=UPI0024BBC8D1|nr:glycerate kinase [Ileibacterium valens]